MLTKLLLSLIAVLGLNTPNQTSSTLSALNVTYQEKPISFLITRKETDNLRQAKRYFFQKNASTFVSRPYQSRPQEANLGFISQKFFKLLKYSLSRSSHQDIVFKSPKKTGFLQIRKKIISYLEFLPFFKSEKELITRKRESHDDFALSFLTFENDSAFSLESSFLFNAISKSEEIGQPFYFDAYPLEEKSSLDSENTFSAQEKTSVSQISQDELFLSSIPEQDRTYTLSSILTPNSIVDNSEEMPSLTEAHVEQLVLLSRLEDSNVNTPVPMTTSLSVSYTSPTQSLNRDIPPTSVLPSKPANSRISVSTPGAISSSSTNNTQTIPAHSVATVTLTAPILPSAPMNIRASAPISTTTTNSSAPNIQVAPALHSGAPVLPTPVLPPKPANSWISVRVPGAISSSSTAHTKTTTPSSRTIPTLLAPTLPSIAGAGQSSGMKVSIAIAAKSSQPRLTSTTTSSSAPPLDQWSPSKGHIQTMYDSFLKQAGIGSISSPLATVSTSDQNCDPGAYFYRWSNNSTNKPLNPLIAQMEKSLRSFSLSAQGAKSTSRPAIDTSLVTSSSSTQASPPTSESFQSTAQALSASTHKRVINSYDGDEEAEVDEQKKQSNVIPPNDFEETLGIS